MAKKSARKEITKINLKQAALEGLSYERACIRQWFRPYYPLQAKQTGFYLQFSGKPQKLC